MVQEKIDKLMRMAMSDLPSEEEIMGMWLGEPDKPEVSVICNTYNHEEYIEDALKGFLIQKTSFPFEVCVHDDASTDKTTEIIKRYQKKYPKIIKPIIQAENQRSKGKRPTLLNFPETSGELIAICEGDDFWFNPHKLECQKELLDLNSEVDLSTHPVPKIAVDGTVLTIILGNQRKKLMPPSQAIPGGGGWCATSSIMIRRGVIQRMSDELATVPVGDLFIKCLGVVRGGAAILSDASSVYRVGVPGSWSNARGTKNRLQEYHDQMQESLSRMAALPDFSGFQNEIKVLKSKTSYSSSIDYLRKKDYQRFRLMIDRSFSHKPFLNIKQTLLFVLSKAFWKRAE